MMRFASPRRLWLAGSLVLGAAACGPGVVVESSGSGGTTTTSSSSTPGTGGSTGTTIPVAGAGGDGSAGGTGVSPQACDPGLPPYDGPLCGPSDMPCQLLADEDLGEAYGGNDAPAVAVGPDCVPHVVFAANMVEYKGLYADRLGPNDWSTSLLPGNSALAGHVIGSDGTSYLLTYDGALQTTLRARPPGSSFQDLGPLPSQGWFTSAGTAIDDADRLHVAFADKDQHLRYMRWEGGTWSQVLFPDHVASAAIQTAVTPQGTAHMLFLGQMDFGWELRHVTVAPGLTPGVPEPITGPEGAPLDPDPQGVRLGLSSDGAPILMFVQMVGDPPAPSMSVLRPDASGQTTLSKLVKPQKDKDPCKNTVPLNAAELCTAEVNVSLFPLAVVVSRGGDVRYLYGRQYTEVTYESQCIGMWEKICHWEWKSDAQRGTIHLARFGANDSVLDAEIAEGRPYSGNAVIDRTGNLHVAVYDATDYEHPARYLQIGP